MKLSSDLPTAEAAMLAKVLRVAKQACEKAGVKLTPLREQILGIVSQSDTPIGAYQIMSELEEVSERTKVAPPTVYRTLDFLLKHKLIHRIHSLNAYINRSNPSSASCEILFICQGCGHAEEVPNSVIQQTINLAANEMRFNIEAQALEIQGQCQDCKSTSAQQKDHNKSPDL